MLHSSVEPPHTKHHSTCARLPQISFTRLRCSSADKATMVNPRPQPRMKMTVRQPMPTAPAKRRCHCPLPMPTAPKCTRQLGSTCPNPYTMYLLTHTTYQHTSIQPYSLPVKMRSCYSGYSKSSSNTKSQTATDIITTFYDNAIANHTRHILVS